MFGRMISLSLAFAAIAGVFGQIPIVTDWAFWVMVAAYLLWLGVNYLSKRRFKWMLMITMLLTMAAVVGIFVEIPIVSNCAFWVMTAAYILIVSSTDIIRVGD